MHSSLAEELPMSPHLAARCALAVLAALLIASAIGLLAMGPVALAPLSSGGGSAWLRALTPWPALAAAACGLWWAGRLRRRPWRHAWRSFFRAAAVAGVFGLLAHTGADGLSGRIARIACGSACATLAIIFLAERLGPRWIAPRVLLLALLAGPCAALAGHFAQALHGQPDERLLLWLETLPVLLLPLGMWGLPSRGLAGADWLVALGGFVAARLAPGFDAEVLAATQGALDGAMLSRWLTAATLLWLGAWLLLRQPGLGARGAARAAAGPASTPPASASQRDTSAKTAG